MNSIELMLDGRVLEVATETQLREQLRVIAAQARFELWISVPDGPSMSMLRNGEHAWLMYLRESGDHGFRSVGDAQRPGSARYWLANGQVDEYPLSYCIDVDQCLEAIAYFHVKGGARAPGIRWIEN